MQAARLPAYRAGLGQRLIKAPKLHLVDSGLACHLCGMASAGALRGSPLLGPLAGTLVVQHLLAFCGVLDGRPAVHYWRTAAGREVDLVVEHGERLLPLELKLRRSVGRGDLRGLGAFLDAYAGRAPFGVVLYGGEEPLRLTRGLSRCHGGCSRITERLGAPEPLQPGRRDPQPPP